MPVHPEVYLCARGFEDMLVNDTSLRISKSAKLGIYHVYQNASKERNCQFKSVVILI
jgi:hypothetical protein